MGETSNDKGPDGVRPGHSYRKVYLGDVNGGCGDSCDVDGVDDAGGSKNDDRWWC